MAEVRKGKQGARPPAPPAGRARWWVTGLGVAVVVAVIVGYFAYRAGADLPGARFDDQGNAHIQMASEPHPPYNSDPPTSGAHLPYIAPWGIHTVPIVRELQVHNLEDGGVVVNFKPQCTDQVLAGLRTIVERYPDHVLLAPYPGLDRCIALTAWTRIEKMDELDERRVVRFIEAYRGIDHHER